MGQRKPIREFIRSPCPDHRQAVLLGKGPSLDTFLTLPREDGRYVMGINETVEVYECDAWIYLDDNFYRMNIRGSPILFRPRTAGSDYTGSTYTFIRQEEILDADDPEEIPHHGWGSGTSAVTILGMWGIRGILLVGFDSVDGPMPEGTPVHAECVRNRLRNQNNRRDFSGIGKGIKNVIEIYGMTPRWFHKELAQR